MVALLPDLARVAEEETRRRLQTVIGCLDPVSSTYNPAATNHLQSMCNYQVLGCTDSLAMCCNPSEFRSCAILALLSLDWLCMIVAPPLTDMVPPLIFTC